jgi:hypothetical protein
MNGWLWRASQCETSHREAFVFSAPIKIRSTSIPRECAERTAWCLVDWARFHSIAWGYCSHRSGDLFLAPFGQRTPIEWVDLAQISYKSSNYIPGFGDFSELFVVGIRHALQPARAIRVKSINPVRARSRER